MHIKHMCMVLCRKYLMHKRRNNKIYSLTYGTQHIHTALGDLEVELFRNYEPCKLGEII